MRRLYIVRHGNTFEAGEAPRRIGCRTDLSLTAEGAAQARKLGAWFAGHGVAFRRALAAPLLRTRQTAMAIAAVAAPDLAVDLVDWLAEIDHGPDEGEAEATVIERVGPMALDDWSRRAIPPPGWIVDAGARIDAWRVAMADAADGDTLIVTSNGAARFALLALHDEPVMASYKLRTGAFGTLVDRGSGWRCQEWNVRPDPAPR